MLPATVDTTWLNGSGTAVRMNHSSPHGSSKSRFDKSRSACSGNAQTNGFRCTLGSHLTQEQKSDTPQLRNVPEQHEAKKKFGAGDDEDFDGIGVKYCPASEAEHPIAYQGIFPSH